MRFLLSILWSKLKGDSGSKEAVLALLFLEQNPVDVGRISFARPAFSFRRDSQKAEQRLSMASMCRVPGKTHSTAFDALPQVALGYGYS